MKGGRKKEASVVRDRQASADNQIRVSLSHTAL